MPNSTKVLSRFDYKYEYFLPFLIPYGTQTRCAFPSLPRSRIVANGRGACVISEYLQRLRAASCQIIQNDYADDTVSDKFAPFEGFCRSKYCFHLC